MIDLLVFKPCLKTLPPLCALAVLLLAGTAGSASAQVAKLHATAKAAHREVHLSVVSKPMLKPAPQPAIVTESRGQARLRQALELKVKAGLLDAAKVRRFLEVAARDQLLGEGALTCQTDLDAAALARYIDTVLEYREEAGVCKNEGLALALSRTAKITLPHARRRVSDLANHCKLFSPQASIACAK
jgi:hypothetical protein